MIHLLVALPAEAKPLNQHFGLRRCQPDGPFPLYRNGNLQLLLTGPGQENATNACRLLLQTSANPEDYWINMGIAGHPSAQIGELFQARCIRNETGDCWKIPGSPFALPQADLITVNAAVDEYPHNALYDMEAAGITAALAAGWGLSQVLVLKIISDNREQPSTQINGRLVKSLVMRHLDTLEKVFHAIDH